MFEDAPCWLGCQSNFLLLIFPADLDDLTPAASPRSILAKSDCFSGRLVMIHSTLNALDTHFVRLWLVSSFKTNCLFPPANQAKTFFFIQLKRIQWIALKKYLLDWKSKNFMWTKTPIYQNCRWRNKPGMVIAAAECPALSTQQKAPYSFTKIGLGKGLCCRKKFAQHLIGKRSGRWQRQHMALTSPLPCSRRPCRDASFHTRAAPLCSAGRALLSMEMSKLRNPFLVSEKHIESRMVCGELMQNKHKLCCAALAHMKKSWNEWKSIRALLSALNVSEAWTRSDQRNLPRYKEAAAQLSVRSQSINEYKLK